MSTEANEQSPAPPPLQGDSISRPTRTRSKSAPIRLTSDNEFILHLSPDAIDELNGIMDLTGDTPTELLRKAIGLYKVTQQAIHEGKAVGIAETPESLDVQFVGI